MAESIALGLRLGTTAEHANFAGIEGEITINETEKRAVVHDGTTKGGFPMARLDETGYALAKSSDGTKLQLKNKAGTVLSETDAPSGGGGSGVYVGNDEPTDTNTDIWLDLDEDSPAIEVDTSNLIKKEGWRGYLGGFESAVEYFCDLESETGDFVWLNSPDVMFSVTPIVASSYFALLNDDSTILDEVPEDALPVATKVMLWAPGTADAAQIMFAESVGGMPYWHIDGETSFEPGAMYMIVFQFFMFFGYANIIKLDQIDLG